MVATNSQTQAEDSGNNPFTLTTVAESVSGNRASKHYLGSPSTEALVEPAQDGTDITGLAPLTGGHGIRGWLSSIYYALINTVTVSIGSTPQNPGTSATTALGVQGVTSGVPVPITAGVNEFVDGSIQTIGTKADTAWSGSGSGSVVALLKSLYAALAGVTNIELAGTIITKDQQFVPKGYFRYALSTVVSLATAIGEALPSGSRVVWIQPEGGDIRFRDDGTNPTASVGFRIYAGTMYPYYGNLPSLELVAVTGTVTLNIMIEG